MQDAGYRAYAALLDEYLKLGRMLYRFIEAVEAEHQT
jgi:hypothetical protein